MKVLVFKISEEKFALDIKYINNITERMDFIPVPNSPDYIKGLINLRGSIITILKISALFNIEEKEFNNIIVFSIDDESVGLPVDEVLEVVDIDESIIQILERDSKKDYISGIVKLDSDLITLINPDKLVK